MTYNPDGKDLHELVEELDPFDEALTDRPSRFFGQVVVDAYKCILVKGKGKVPYNPDEHKDQQTSVAISFTVAPLDATRKMITREVLNWVVEFRQVIRPSIEALAEDIAKIKGLTLGEFNPLKELSGMWIGGEFVPRPDNKAGETWTTLQFQAVYPDREACEAAAMEAFGLDSEQAEPEAIVNGGDNARAAVRAFLPSLWAQANGDATKMGALIKANPMVSQFYTIDSPEVQEVMAK